jgi:hypothetical protein
MDNMISLDVYIKAFISNNSFFLLLVYSLLKGTAKVTPWAHDDKIIQIFGGLIPFVKKSKNGGTKK